MAEARLERIPIDRIEVDPENIRTGDNAEQIAVLNRSLAAAHMRGDEYLNPPVVYPVGDNRYRVLTGNQRLKAARGVLTEMAVNVTEAPRNDQERIVAQLTENALRDELNPMDEARALARLQQHPDLDTGGKLLNFLTEHGFSYTKQKLQQKLTLLRLPKEVQDLVAARRMSGTIGATLSRVQDPARVLDLARQVLEQDLSVAALQRLIDGSAGVDRAEDAESGGRVGSQLVSPPGWTDTGGAPWWASYGGLPAEVNRAEYVQRDVDDLIQEANHRPRSQSSIQRRVPDAEHRAGRMETHLELVPATLVLSEEEEGKDAEALATIEWLAAANKSQQGMVRELMRGFGVPAMEAVALVEQGNRELNGATDALRDALLCLGQLVSDPALARDSRTLVRLLKARADLLARMVLTGDNRTVG